MPDDKNKKSRCLKLWQSMEKDVRALYSFKMFSVSRSCRAGHISAGLCKDNDEECFIMDGNEEEAVREDPCVFVTDGAWKKNLLRGAVAWIRRDARGKPGRNSSAGMGGKDRRGDVVCILSDCLSFVKRLHAPDKVGSDIRKMFY